MQGAESQLSQVADRKLADRDVINQGDATQIARAEAKLNDGQIPPNSISAKAQVNMIRIVAFLVSVCRLCCHGICSITLVITGLWVCAVAKPPYSLLVGYVARHLVGVHTCIQMSAHGLCRCFTFMCLGGLLIRGLSLFRAWSLLHERIIDGRPAVFNYRLLTDCKNRLLIDCNTCH